MTPVTTLKTVPDPGGHGQGCVVCALALEDVQKVNAVIWDGTRHRTKGYRAAGQRAYFAATNETIDPKTVTRHADHTEKTWREPSQKQPVSAVEVPVFPTDYESMVDAAAGLGALATSKLEERVREDKVEDKLLVALAGLGVKARAQQAGATQGQNSGATTVNVIMGMASGHLAGQLPSAEAIDVTPVGELYAEIDAEKAAMRGEDEDDFAGL